MFLVLFSFEARCLDFSSPEKTILKLSIPLKVFLDLSIHQDVNNLRKLCLWKKIMKKFNPVENFTTSKKKLQITQSS